MVEQTVQQPPFSVLPFAAGIAGVIIGALIAGFSPDGSGLVPGSVIMAIGAALWVPGQLAFRRALARTRFRLSRKWTPSAALVPLIGFAVLVGGGIGVAVGLDRLLGIRVPGAVFILAGIPVVMGFFLSFRTLLLINRLGVSLPGLTAPWESVRKVIITRQPEPALTVRRTPPAEPGPGDEGRPEITITSDRIDPEQVLQALRRFGPPDLDVAVISHTGDQDRAR